MTHVLGTVQDKVRWYRFDVVDGERVASLVDVLDLRTVSCFGDKESARISAVAAGLKTWRYFKF